MGFDLTGRIYLRYTEAYFIATIGLKLFFESFR